MWFLESLCAIVTLIQINIATEAKKHLTGVAPHAHQLKNFIMPPKQKNCPFSPEDVNFLILGYLFVLA